jgi:hypothetical protein
MSILIALAAPLVLLPLAYFAWVFVMYRRPPVTGVTHVVQYEPPKGLRPAEAALLLDTVLKPRALAATLVDLHLRGALTIVVGHNGHITEFHRGRSGAELDDFERTLVDAILGGEDAVAAKTAGERAAAVARKTEHLAKQALHIKGMYAYGLWHEELIFGAIVAGAATLFAAMLPIAPLELTIGVPASIVLIAQLAYIATTWRPPLSKTGSEAVAHLLGYREFIRQVEGDNLRWAEKTEGRMDTLTPYAIVFDASLTWATKLQSLTKELLKNVL